MRNKAYDRPLLETTADAINHVFGGFAIEGWSLDTSKGMRLVRHDTREWVGWFNPLDDYSQALQLTEMMKINIQFILAMWL